MVIDDILIYKEKTFSVRRRIIIAYDKENVVFRQSCISITEEQAVGDKTARGGEE